MRTRYRVALVLSCIAAMPALLPAQDRTDADVVRLIVRDGPRARAIRAAAEVVGFEQAARLTFPNPSASYTREGAGFTEFLQMEQTLPAFGLRATLTRAGVAARQAAEAERDARLWELETEAWAHIVRLRAEAGRLRAMEANVTLVERLIAILRTREQEGEGSRFDRVRAEQELADARQALLATSLAVSEARHALVSLLPPGVAIPDLPAVVAPRASTAATAPLDALLRRARSSRAELRALQRAAERFDVEAEIARRAFRPAPLVVAGVKRADNDERRQTGGVAGIAINVPIFNTGAREAARWTAERLRVDAERASLEAEIQVQVMRASDALALRREALAALGSSPSAADELVTIADVAYREGDIGILELLDAYRAASRARLRAIDINLEARLAELALERAVGETLWP